MTQAGMKHRTVIDYTDNDQQTSVEVGVQYGEDLTDVSVSLDTESIGLRLDVDELDDLIAALVEARAAVRANA